MENLFVSFQKDKKIYMKKIVKLTESDLIRLVKKIINEQPTNFTPTGGNRQLGPYSQQRGSARPTQQPNRVSPTTQTTTQRVSPTTQTTTQRVSPTTKFVTSGMTFNVYDNKTFDKVIGIFEIRHIQQNSDGTVSIYCRPKGGGKIDHYAVEYISDYGLKFDCSSTKQGYFKVGDNQNVDYYASKQLWDSLKQQFCQKTQNAEVPKADFASKNNFSNQPLV